MTIRDVSVSRVVAWLAAESADVKRGDLVEARARVGDASARATALRHEVRGLREASDQLIAEARAVDRPDGFFERLFDGGSAEREIAEKTHAAEAKSLAAGEGELAIATARRAAQDGLARLREAIGQHTSTTQSLTRLVRDDEAHARTLLTR